MFTFDSTIDAVQSGKKMFVKTFVQNPAVAEALNEFVDAQSAYTKQALKATTNAATTLVSESTKAMQDAVKFDYVKFGEGVMRAYQNLQSKTA